MISPATRPVAPVTVGLGGEHRPAARDGGESGADHSGRVLGGDRERSEDTEGELDDEHSAEADLDRVEGGPVDVAGLDRGGGEHADADGEATAAPISAR